MCLSWPAAVYVEGWRLSQLERCLYWPYLHIISLIVVRQEQGVECSMLRSDCVICVR